MDRSLTGSKVALLILSAYVFSRATSAPVRNPTLPPFGPSLSEMREWLLIRVVVYMYPFIRILYMIITFFECLFILSTTDCDLPMNSIKFLGVHLSLPTQPCQSPRHIANIGLLIGVLGGLLRFLCFKTLGNSFTYDIRQSPKLVTTGPYSFVRHPSYLGVSLLVTGITVYHLSPGSWVRESDVLNHIIWRIAVGLWILITVFFTYLSQILRVEDEDRLMKKMFGEEWEAWRKVVRYKIIPGLY